MASKLQYCKRCGTRLEPPASYLVAAQRRGLCDECYYKLTDWEEEEEDLEDE